MSFRSSVEELYRTARDQLFTYALSITGDSSLSEDVVQDVFRRLCQEPVDAKDLRSYVFRSVRNRALDHVRFKSRSGRPTGDSTGWASIYRSDAATPEERMVSAETARQVEAALYELEPDERECIVLHIYGEMTFETMSKVLEAPMGTVASRYRRGLAKLRETLGREMP
jgi:RNA polymerase sigma-70 factor (ECF subfamily)